MKRQKELIKNFLNNEKAILIILDACRYDYFIKYFSAAHPVISEGSATFEWFNKTWTWKEKYEDIAYITANPYINKIGYMTNANKKFVYIDEVWDWGWGNYKGIPTVPAENVVKGVHKAISKGFTKIVAHFMQPHPPYIGDTPLAIETFITAKYIAAGNAKAPIETRRYSSVNNELLKKAYDDNLKYVIQNGIKPFFKLKFKIAITADHGEMLGEYGIYGHSEGRQEEELIRVPWLVIDRLNASRPPPCHI